MNKLTKKQRKSLVFRQKLGKNKAPAEALEELKHATDPQDLQRLNFIPDNDPPTKGPPEQTGKKRKRAADYARTGNDMDFSGPDNTSNCNPVKNRRTTNKRAEEETASIEGASSEDDERSRVNSKESRYILFAGNLKYTTSKEAIVAHFAACGPAQVRLLTPKSSNTTKSKGCAFIEFSSKSALQSALRLHHSELEGRKINVELTAGGGGKSEQRLRKLQERNRELTKQRTKRLKKDAKATAECEGNKMEGTQRHSSTSGIDATHVKKHTWSVPETGGRPKSRGGKEHEKRRQRRKDLATGVNAIPVG